MVRSSRVPDRGDLVWLEFDPQAGREQAGRRPALVLSPARYNEKASLMLCCPLTTQIKGYPFEVPVQAQKGGPPSVVLADQVRSLDWRARKAKRFDRATPQCMTAVLAKVSLLLS